MNDLALEKRVEVWFQNQNPMLRFGWLLGLLVEILVQNSQRLLQKQMWVLVIFPLDLSPVILSSSYSKGVKLKTIEDRVPVFFFFLSRGLLLTVEYQE